jgi:hypothetical protein
MVKSLAKNKKKLIETIMFSNRIDTVMGTCSGCEEDAILVAIVSDYYRCTSCGHDNRQHINGKITYLKLTDEDKKFIKLQSRLNNG